MLTGVGSVTLRVTAVAAVLGLAVLASALMSQPRQPSNHEMSDAFWRAASVEGLERETYDSLRALIEAADLVVLGTIVDVSEGRQWPVPSAVPGGEAAAYARVHLHVDDILLNGAQYDTADLSFELFLTDAEGLEALAGMRPREPTVFVLRNKGEDLRALGAPIAAQAQEAPFFRLINQGQGYYRNVDGRVHASVAHDDGFPTVYEGMPFGEFLATVEETVD